MEPAAKALTVTVPETKPIDTTHPLFRFPATVRIVTRDSVVRREVMVTKQTETFTLALPGAPITFRFDEGGWLLGTVKTDQTPEELSELAKHDLDLAGRWRALSALDSSSAPVARDTRRFIALNDAVDQMRAEAVRQLGTHDRTNSRDMLQASLGDPSGRVRAEAIRSLAMGDTGQVQAEAAR